jgi:tetratricopeptide (TPR) repeat protein
MFPAQPLPQLGDGLALFDPFSRSFGLIGRKTEMDALERWVHGAGLVSLRVMCGEGGMGKTRLALELCDRLRALGWEAGFLTGDALQAFAEQAGVEAWRWFRPMLIVVDQAAAHGEPLARWLPLLAKAQARAEHPLRVLLLERHANPRRGWWRQVFADEGARGLLAPACPVPLRPLGNAARRAILNASLACLGSSERVPPLEGDDAFFDQPIATLRWAANPLYLMMAAWRARSVDLRHLFVPTRSELVIPLARAELGRLKQLAHSRRLPDEVLCHMAALVTLWGGATPEELEAALPAELVTLRQPDVPVEALLAALQEALPGTGNGRLAPIQPAAVGAGFILGMLARRTYAEAVILRAWQQKGWPVVDRLIQAVMDCGNGDEKPPTRWLVAIAAQLSSDSLRWRLLNRLPPQHDGLDGFALNLARALGAAPSASIGASAMSPDEALHQAARLDQLAWREDQEGRLDAAWAARTAGVALLRGVCDGQRGAACHALALGLAHLGTLAGRRGELDAALAAAQETLALRQALAAAYPTPHAPELAMAWNNLGNAFTDAGETQAARAPLEQALSHFRALEAQSPGVFAAELAMCLNNLALAHGEAADAAQQDKARAMLEEAIALQRPLVRGPTDREAAHLALFISNLANFQAASLSWEMAIGLAEEAVGLRRQLYAHKPELYRSSLAAALSNLSQRYQEAEQLPQALAMAREALSLWSIQFQLTPEATRPALARAEMGLARCLQAQNAFVQALEHYQSALEILLPAARKTPKAYGAWLRQGVEHYLRCCDRAKVPPQDVLVTEALEAAAWP